MNHITCNKSIRSGQPVISDTRYPISQLLADLAISQSVIDYAENTDIEVDKLRGVLLELADQFQKPFSYFKPERIHTVNAVTTVLATAGIPNTNGNIYPEEVLRNAVEQFQAVQDCSFGMFNDQDDLTSNPSIIRMKDVSHRIKDMHFDEESKELTAYIEILSTPRGKILQQLIDNAEFKLRGIGSVTNGIMDANYKFISVDAVQKQ